jgi:uroporphyrinogen-III synthase
MAEIVMIGASTLDPRLWRSEARAAVAGARLVAAPASADMEAVSAAVEALAPGASLRTPPPATTAGGVDATAAWLHETARDRGPRPLVWFETSDPLWMHGAAALYAALLNMGASCHALHGAPVGTGETNFVQALVRVDATAEFQARLERSLHESAATLPLVSEVTMRRTALAPFSSGVPRDLPWDLTDGGLLPSPQYPLVGRRVGTTHAPSTARVPFSAVLAGLGATGVALPCLRFSPPRERAALDAAAFELPGRGAIVTSAQGALALFESLVRVHGSAPAATAVLAATSLATIGPRTANALSHHGITPALVASPSHAEGLVALLRARGRLSDPWTLFRADEARDTLPDAMKAARGDLKVVEAYRVVAPEVTTSGARAVLGLDLPAHALDAVCVTSGLAARHLLRLVERALSTTAAHQWLRTVPLISIGPVTSDALTHMGLPVAHTADQPSHAGLARALAEVLRGAAHSPTARP